MISDKQCGSRSDGGDLAAEEEGKANVGSLGGIKVG